MRLRRFGMLLLALLLACSVLPVRAAAPAGAGAEAGQELAKIPLEARRKIAPALLKQLLDARDAQAAGKASTVTYLVQLRERASSQGLAAIPSLSARRQEVVGRLQATAAHSQAGVVRYLGERLAQHKITRFQSYWVFNGLAVDGDLETAVALALRPEVEALRPNRTLKLPAPQPSLSSSTLASEPAWGVSKIGADRVWQAFSITGEGVVVANLDSGVDWTHPALQRKYRGYNAQNPAASVHDYNWHDYTGTYPNAPGPNQAHISTVSDHGTHTMGTMVGSSLDGKEQVGVAPGARWVAVKVFADNGDALDEWIHAGFQWCLAPTDLRGQNPDPSKAPDIVNNSWGDDHGSDLTFHDDIAALNAAGIFSTFSAGNAGPNPGTIGSPASFDNVFAVGATDSVDQIASFSSRGPSPFGQIKPDIDAPGVNIRSTIAGGSYESGWNGTSMAAPHVAGVVALLWQAARLNAGATGAPGLAKAPPLSLATTQYVITSTATHLGSPIPNNTYGYGRVDAYQAVSTIIQSGTFAGRVTEAGSGRALAGVMVQMTNLATSGEATAYSASDGSYSLAVAQGTYDVKAELFGYATATAHYIQILPNTLTQLDLTLEPLPSGVIRGRVTRAADGQPAYATVEAIATPARVTVDAQGYYTLTVPAGSYAVRALGTTPGFRGMQVSDVQVAAGGTVTVNLTLAAAPRILLVDADAWVPASQIGYYRRMLDDLLYSYNVHPILQTPDDNLGSALLAGYDLVIWSQPQTSPGYINAWVDLATYLDQGGKLLISGPDIGYWDEGRGQATTYYRDYLHAAYLGDNGGIEPLAGTAGEILAGLSLRYNTEDSARNQTAPDALGERDAIAHAIIGPQGGGVAGLRADACANRVLYLGFGLEGVGPQSAREELLARAITWLGAGRPGHAVEMRVTEPNRSVLAGSNVVYDLTVINSGMQSSRYRLIESSAWPVRLIDPTTGEAITQTQVLTPCGSASLRLEVAVPATAAAAESRGVGVTASSPGMPDVTQEMEITAFQPWSYTATLTPPRYRASVAATDCAVWVIGGMLADGSDRALRTVSRYDLRSGAWATLSERPSAAADAAIAALAGRLYVLGGYDPSLTASPYLDTALVYDPATNAWSALAPLPQKLGAAAATTLAGRIYLLGGKTAAGDIAAAYVYDPAQGTWSPLPEMPTALSSASAAALDGMIYVLGGWPNESVLYRFDPQSNAWTVLHNMTVGRQGCAAAAAGGFLYVAGGGNEWNGLDSVERYDPLTDTWTELPFLLASGHAGAGGVYADGRFFVVAGKGGSDSTIEALAIDPPLNGSYLAATPDFAKNGDAVRYNLTVRNTAAAASNASWSHVLPDGLEYVAGSATGGAVYESDRRELHWTGTMPAGVIRAFTFQARVGAQVADETVLTSTVRLEDGGCAPSILQTSIQVLLPSLSRSTKTVDKVTVQPGGRLHYTIDVSNGSPYTISSASLVDVIPPHTRLVSDTLRGATYNTALNRLEWQGSLPPADDTGEDFHWIDASSGTRLDLTDDSCTGPRDLGFRFTFYGQTYTQIYINSNGMVLFDKCSQAYRNTTIPSADEPNAFAAPFWDDLAPGDSGAFYMATFGAPGHRMAVVEWQNVTYFGQTEQQTFEAIFYEGTNRVIFQYLKLNGERGAGSSATVGIENQSGTEGVQYLYNGSPAEHQLHSLLTLEMVQPSTLKPSTHPVSYDVRVDDDPPPLTVITNTALISDQLATHTRVVTTVVDSPDLATSSLKVEPPQAASGETVTFILEFVNTGQLTATNVTALDPLPEGLTFVEGSLLGQGATYNAAAKRIEWHGNLPVDPLGVQITYQTQVTRSLPLNALITNTASIWERGVLMASPQATLSVNAIDLSASAKTAHASEVTAGTPITYSILVRNDGLATASRVRVLDPLPATLELISASLVGGTYDALAHTISWEGVVTPGSSHAITFQVETDGNTPDGTTILNNATIDSGIGQPIGRQAQVVVRRGSLSQSDLTVSPGWLGGNGVVTYTLRLRNTGGASIGGLLSGTVPTPLEVVPGSLYASSGETSLTGGALSWQGIIAARGMVIVRFQARAPASTPGQAAIVRVTLVDSGGIAKELAATVIINGHRSYLPHVNRSAVRP